MQHDMKQLCIVSLAGFKELFRIGFTFNMPKVFFMHHMQGYYLSDHSQYSIKKKKKEKEKEKYEKRKEQKENVTKHWAFYLFYYIRCEKFNEHEIAIFFA